MSCGGSTEAWFPPPCKHEYGQMDRKSLTCTGAASATGACAVLWTTFVVELLGDTSELKMKTFGRILGRGGFLDGVVGVDLTMRAAVS